MSKMENERWGQFWSNDLETNAEEEEFNCCAVNKRMGVCAEVFVAFPVSLGHTCTL